MERFSFINLDTGQIRNNLDIIFPNWQGESECLCVYSPHDDDAIIGAGYAMRAALDSGARVYVLIVCSGNAGYSTLDTKDTIVATRKRETLACYRTFGIPEENIIYLDFPDFSAISYVGWQLAHGGEGHFRRTISELRAQRVTRILAPNHYREHIDHLAASMMATYDAPQCGDAVAVDFGEPNTVASVAEYSVWADLDPEDAMLNGRDSRLRANALAVAPPEVEEGVRLAIRKYETQQTIIADLVRQREERRLPDGRYIEAYLKLDPRPRLNYQPYRDAVAKLIQNEAKQ